MPDQVLFTGPGHPSPSWWVELQQLITALISGGLLESLCNMKLCPQPKASGLALCLNSCSRLYHGIQASLLLRSNSFTFFSCPDLLSLIPFSVAHFFHKSLGDAFLSQILISDFKLLSILVLTKHQREKKQKRHLVQAQGDMLPGCASVKLVRAYAELGHVGSTYNKGQWGQEHLNYFTWEIWYNPPLDYSHPFIISVLLPSQYRTSNIVTTQCFHFFPRKEVQVTEFPSNW